MTRWVTAGQAAGEDSGGQASACSRAIVGSLEDRATPATVTGFAEADHERLGELSARYGKQVQRPQLQLSDGYRPFDIFPVRSGDPHDWERAAADHEAWKLVADGADVKEMREDTLTLVRHLTKARLTAGSPGGTSRDAWTDAGFAARVSTQLEFLLTSVEQIPERAAEGSFTLSPAEASLLAAAPYLHDTHWATQRADWAGCCPPPTPRAIRPASGSTGSPRGSREFAGGPRQRPGRPETSLAGGSCIAGCKSKSRRPRSPRWPGCCRSGRRDGPAAMSSPTTACEPCCALSARRRVLRRP